MRLPKALSWGFLLVILSGILHIGLFCNTNNRNLTQGESSTNKTANLAVQRYSQQEISKTARHFKLNHPRLLVFDGHHFVVYNLDHKHQYYKKDNVLPGRSGKAIPLLVHALKELNHTRFERGQPVFQMLFLDSDAPNTDCFNTPCPSQDFCPVLMFGSVPKNETILPTVKAFPNWFYISCLHDYKLLGKNQCHWSEPVVKGHWNSLQPTLVWRGTDFHFLNFIKKFRFAGAKSLDLSNVTSSVETVDMLLQHWDDLTPRWRGVALAAQAHLQQLQQQHQQQHQQQQRQNDIGSHNQSSKVLKSNHNSPSEVWIDSKFVGPDRFGGDVHLRFLSHGVPVEALNKMTSVQMARYKYLIDFGGGGGTSWRGVITKLGLPGVLFHHETPMKDWFFDDMKPWVHYIPVSWHVGDLRERYDWAEQNPSDAKQIAKAASVLYHNLMSETYMRKLYDDLFVDYLGTVLGAHVDSERSWAESLEMYEQEGYELRKVATCDDRSCSISGRTVTSTKSVVKSAGTLSGDHFSNMAASRQ